MEGVSWTPEQDTDDDESPDFEKKEKETKKDNSKERRLPLFERKEIEPADDKKSRRKESQAETTAEEDSEVPLESATNDERQLVIEARTNELAPELESAEPDSVEEAAVLADIAYIEAVHSRAEAGETIDDEMLDSALAETIERLYFDTEPTESADDIEDAPADVIDEIIELDADDDTEVDLPLTASTSPPSPPVPPVPPATSGGGSAMSPLMPTGVPPAASLSPNVAPRHEETQVERRSTAGPLLLGGIIGYMIGRRRGRIKTEKKLLPIQKKLEAEVKGLHEKLILREEKIRNVVREQTAKKPELKQKIIERVERAVEKPEPTPEVQATHKKPEELGKFAVLAERPKATEKSPEQIKSVEGLNKTELLSIAERITLEHDENVKRLYESNRIDDRGLKRIVRAYLKGERYDHLIMKNLVTPERYNYAETLQPGANMNNQARPKTAAASYDSRTNPQLDDQRQTTPDVPYAAPDDAPQTAPAHGSDPLTDFQNWQPPSIAMIATAAVVIALIIIIWLL